MFGFLKDVKMKYKLVFVSALPFVVLLFFVGKLLWNDYKVMSQVEQDQQTIQIFQKAEVLFENLNNEADLSLLKLNGIQFSGIATLDQVRKELDEAVEQLVASYSSTDANQEVSEAASFLFNELGQLRPLRAGVDQGGISGTEVAESFSKLELMVITFLSELGREAHDPNLARTLLNYIAILHLQSAASDERRIVLEIMNSDEVTARQRAELDRAMSLQEAWRNAYFELGTNKLDAFYQKIVSGKSLGEADKIREQVLQESAEGRKAMDPKLWWNIQTQNIGLLHTLDDEVVQDAEEIVAKDYQITSREFYAILATIFVIIPLTVILVIVSLRSIVKKLQEEIEILSLSGNEIMNSIAEASSGTSETATSVTETTTTVEELKQTAEAAAEKAKNISQVSKDAIDVIRGGERALDETVEGMHRIQNGMSTISESIIKLSEHSQSIGEIIDTVNELAEQSHLLAVNAAIEAAKAGEQGKGFSVVAQEVRSLAEQSKQATIQVRSILNDIQNATSAAVMATEQGSKAVQNGVEKSNLINDSIKQLSAGIIKVDDAFSQIALSSEQQLVGVSQVNVAIANIREASERHVEHMRQIEKAIEGMNAVGTSLKDLVIKF